METNKIYLGDSLEVLKTFPDESIDMCMTSPPYWALRDYGVQGQLGLEPTFQEYISRLVGIFDEVKRILKKSGSCWVNLGDTYSNSGGAGSQYGKHRTETLGMKKYGGHSVADLQDKCLCMIPERFAIAMCEHGWVLRNQIIWHKPNCMPSSVKDRFTVDFEKLFFFVKSKKYFFETQRVPVKEESIKRACRARTTNKLKENKYAISYVGENIGYDDMLENYKAGKLRGVHKDGRNMRTTWTISLKPFHQAHFATYPEELCETPVKAGCPISGIVLDPFFGAGTTGLVALKQNKKFIGIELNEEYIKIAYDRLRPYLEQKKMGEY